MRLTVRLFAVARELADAESIELDLPAAATVADLRQGLVARLPRLAKFGPLLRFAVNAEYAEDATPILYAAEVACIPPVSGG